MTSRRGRNFDITPSFTTTHVRRAPSTYDNQTSRWNQDKPVTAALLRTLSPVYGRLFCKGCYPWRCMRFYAASMHACFLEIHALICYAQRARHSIMNAATMTSPSLGTASFALERARLDRILCRWGKRVDVERKPCPRSDGRLRLARRGADQPCCVFQRGWSSYAPLLRAHQLARTGR
jgi:hypothetical protein